MSDNITNAVALIKFFFILLFTILVVGGIHRLLDLLNAEPSKRKQSTKLSFKTVKSKATERDNREQTSLIKNNKSKSMRKGEWGEEKDWMELSHLSSEYKVLHDILIPYKNWDLDYSQIDHVVISAYGIFVIEAKNYTGVIIGSEEGKWYQDDRLIKNPIKQNEKHINAIKALLLKQGYRNLLFHNIVTLNARCNMNQVTALSVVPDIHLQNLIEKRSRQRVLSLEQVVQIHNILDKSNIRDKKIRDLHIRQIKAIMDSEFVQCAKCGRKVTMGVKDYCLDHPERFYGRIYCMEHQR